MMWKKHTMITMFIGKFTAQEDYFFKLNSRSKIAQSKELHNFKRTFFLYLLPNCSLEILKQFTVPSFLKSPQH